MSRRAAAVVLACLSAGCTTYARGAGDLRAPVPGTDGATAGPAVDQSEPYGYTVEVTVAGGVWRGELVGCDAEGIYLLLHETSPDAAHYLAWEDFTDGEIPLGSQSWVMALVWGLLGTASSASHGVFAIYSAPIWAGLTIVTTIAYAAAGSSEDLPDTGPGIDRCCELAPWSRFPSGVPVEMARRYRPVPEDSEAARLGRVPSCPAPALRTSADEQPAPAEPSAPASPSATGRDDL